MGEFATSEARLTLDQADVAQAVEYWLNERVLKVPCEVVGFMQEGASQWKAVTFKVVLAEGEGVREAGDG